jgi:hypothetical protein
MWAFIWLGLVLLLVTALLMLSKYEEGFAEEGDDDVDYSQDYDVTVADQGPISINKRSAPDDATIEILQDKIYNMSPPPGVDLGDTTIYAPVDLAADMKSIKNQLRNLQMNLPDTIKDNVSQQVYPLINGVLRQNGFPMTDDTYGTGIYTLPEEEVE